MKYFSYGLIIAIFITFFVMIYYASYQGWGTTPLHNSIGIYRVGSYNSGGGSSSSSALRTGGTGSRGTSSRGTSGNFRSGSKAGRGK
ncbi:MAG: hypothetical protein EAZ31_06645 [Cytophagia bacterium]|nr:MAG: hypothetical protein EAY69_07755 [Cytophagales bacterium]TAG42141.1 MAG: hypothetical protein EAZ31_06645 [Cytophagia bacterium]TAH29639.1 MAG: hypothetical protein EAZ06_06040 [Cytophagales bacterium]